MHGFICICVCGSRRKDPVLRNRVFFGLIGVGLTHGLYLITRSTNT